MARLQFNAVCLLSLAMTVGCASKPQTSRLTSDDLIVASDKMVQSLGKSEFLAGRTPGSPPVVIITNKVENLTDNIIPVGEQWMTVARVQNGLPMQQFSQSRNVKFVLPPERRRMAAAAGGVEVPDGGGLVPTHVLAAQFTSSARTNQDKSGNVVRKQDYYYLEFKLTEVQGREIVWSDAFEFKREAAGLLID